MVIVQKFAQTLNTKDFKVQVLMNFQLEQQIHERRRLNDFFLKASH